MESRYFERLASSLERKAGQETRLLAAAAEAETRKARHSVVQPILMHCFLLLACLLAWQRQAKSTPLIYDSLDITMTLTCSVRLVLRTRRIKVEAEGALMAAFGGRKVNILGDINTVLSSTGI